MLRLRGIDRVAPVVTQAILHLFLGSIHRRVCGAVHHHFRLFCTQTTSHLFGIRNVEGGSGKRPDIVASLARSAHDCATQQAGRAGDQDPQDETLKLESSSRQPQE